MSDFPTGDGLPNCPTCSGRGVVFLHTPGDPRESTRPCSCVLVRDVAMNIERGWRGLLNADAVPSSPLREYVSSNLRVTSSRRLFRAHLKHVAARMPPQWGFLVVTDADLMDAWLSRKLDVKDVDVQLMRQKAEIHQYDALVDLIEPPPLLVLICGVKAARNEAMPEVLLEVLNCREHRSRVTWIVDQPTYRLADGHISYSHAVGDFLEEWPRVTLSSESVSEEPAPPLVTYRTYRSPLPTQIDIPNEPFSFDTETPSLDTGRQGTRSLLDSSDGDVSQKKKKPRRR